MKPVIKIKRIYDRPLKKDGYRILVDRLWPRAVSKEKAAIDEWAKELAPEAALRKWFNHDPDRWHEFQKRYRAELKKNTALETFTEAHSKKSLITLLYAAKDTEHNHALVLQQFLQEQYS